MGTIDRQKFIPEPIGDTVFSYFPGQMVKLFGLTKSLVAYDVTSIICKGVVAVNSDEAEIFVVSALVNNLEAD